MDADVPETTRRQDGLVQRAQALAHGMGDSAIRHRVRTGRWQRLLPGVYATFPGPLTARQYERAALLFAGHDAQVAGVSACRRHGLRCLPPPDGTVSVLVPHDRHRGSTGFAVVRRTTRLARAADVGGLPTSPAARAVADASRLVPTLRDIRALLHDAVGSGHVRIADIDRELVEGGPAGSALARRALADLRTGLNAAS